MFFFRSLRAKTVATVLIPTAVVLVAVAVIALFAYDQVSDDAEQVVQGRDSELARITAARLSEALSQHSRVLQSTAADDDVESLEPARLSAALERSESQLRVFDAGVVIYDNERVALWPPSFAGRPQRADFLARSVFETVQSTLRPAFSNVFPDPRSGEDLIVMGVPIVGSGNEFQGAIAGLSTLRFSPLGETYSEILELTAGREGFAYLVDGEGRVIYHRDTTQLGADFTGTAPVMRAIRKETGALFMEDSDGRRVISGFAPVPGTDWGVITQERWDNVAGPVRDYGTLLLVLLGVGGGASGLLIFFAVGRILKPVKDLTRGAQRIAGGDFDHTISAETGDEIQGLAEQFNTMAGALKDSYADLEGKVETRTKALRESEQLLNTVVTGAPVALFVVNREGAITLLEGKGLDALGLKPGELVGQSVFDVYRDVPEIVENARRSLAGEEVAFVVELGDSTFEFRSSPLRGENGEVVGLIGIATDITERKRSEEALRNSETMLRHSEKMAILGTLTAGVAHELNNPAAAVKSAAGQLEAAIAQFGQAQSELSRVVLSAGQQEALQRLLHQAREQAKSPSALSALARSDRERELENWLEERGLSNARELAPALADLNYDTAGLTTMADEYAPDQLSAVIGGLVATYVVHNMLTETGQSAGRISEIVKALKSYSYLDQAPVQAVDVHEGLDNTLLVLAHKLKSGIGVRKEYAPDLPKIQANGGELNQVWTNIIDNAADALEGQGEITIRTRQDGERVLIEIEDDGPGIPAEIQSRIFEPFFTTKPPGLGTGLGLDISYNVVVHKHRGDIRVLSQPGRTCFQVWLPVNFEAR